MTGVTERKNTHNTLKNPARSLRNSLAMTRDGVQCQIISEAVWCATHDLVIWSQTQAPLLQPVWMGTKWRTLATQDTPDIGRRSTHPCLVCDAWLHGFLGAEGGCFTFNPTTPPPPSPLVYYLPSHKPTHLPSSSFLQLAPFPLVP